MAFVVASGHAPNDPHMYNHFASQIALTPQLPSDNSSHHTLGLMVES